MKKFDADINDLFQMISFKTPLSHRTTLKSRVNRRTSIRLTTSVEKAGKGELTKLYISMVRFNILNTMRKKNATKKKKSKQFSRH